MSILSKKQSCETIAIKGQLTEYVAEFDHQAAHRISNAASAVRKGGVLAFGILIIYAVGFLPLEAVHNAAHDTRHAFVFPCH
ncbi:CbtB domain-containing protein [Marinobacterium lacunae]|uniref:CbtB domain-containing protein n=1 Tax=Marinobacterium lacunae TaxID=1232683 RepID=UPI00068A0D27|nr:CbtB domain-containing protein [Marinobacterium lacunae]